ncbi:saccharopine dehydrogenase family protein [Indiicoccus explosivorum]|uniref:saccharopine dehydrogenase family protein n=1 Tax=Indiicoccus explosivorum TaxID=1917864 RepID=UPI000B441B6F|nr:saccharopine dehydrogenase NADP-binding domain-containing protein [Indiicoccus explosivorum]
MASNWMIYGANGYTGGLIAREAKKRGLSPVLAGRSETAITSLARELELESRIFPLEHDIAKHLEGIRLVLHCAGPFRNTSAPMVSACLSAGAHYLDITGEIAVFEHTHAQHEKAVRQGVVLCSGAGFDVIPTDCTALRLQELMPDTERLSLGFDTDSGVSRGTLKTMIDGLGGDSAIRQSGVLLPVPLGSQVRKIDFGRGLKTAMGIPWGDVSTAFHTTGILDISTWIPMSKARICAARFAAAGRPILNSRFVKSRLDRFADRRKPGPDRESRERSPAFIWGEAVNARGEAVTVRIRTANTYDLTVWGALEMSDRLLRQRFPGGSYTPARLFGSSFIEQLPGSGLFETETI